MNERDRRINAEIERDIATGEAIKESVQKEAAINMAANEAVRRDYAQRAAMEQRMRADDAERASFTMANAAINAEREADAARNKAFTTGFIALLTIVALVLGGSVLYNGYKEKNDRLYAASTTKDKVMAENRMLERENQRARNANAPQGGIMYPAAQPTTIPSVIVVPSPAAPVAPPASNPAPMSQERTLPAPAPTGDGELRAIVVPPQADPVPATDITSDGTTTTTVTVESAPTATNP